MARQSPYLLGMVCEALAKYTTDLPGLRYITLEAFDSSQSPNRTTPLLDAKEEDGKFDFKTLMHFIRRGLPVSEDRRVICSTARGLDMSKIEIQVTVTFQEEEEEEEDDSDHEPEDYEDDEDHENEEIDR
ncbi:hypothetical protein FOMPIDRAFT_90754 [Fomitopsis schrenkii]|uniref:Uncharacterized protein n=1 Tax=Fomitopsis schrenkii TaxID=2126942 RepID=S8FF76_FOMSC|nr:hypothetical protein FOMPIDRAFT_90754 [Fomitopsis schrenkii]